MTSELAEFQGGAGEALADEIDLSRINLAAALRILRRLGGTGLACWVPRLPSIDGGGPPLAACELSGSGVQRWLAFVKGTGGDLDREILATDEEHDGGHYLALHEPPVALCELDGARRPQAIVGLFMGTILWVDEGFRGRGGGSAMVEAAADARGGLPLAGHAHSGYSKGGLAAVRAAHRRIVARNEGPGGEPGDLPDAGAAFPR